MTMHEHPERSCEHTLKHCAHCDVVFCEKCKREWKQPKVDMSGLRDYFQQQEPPRKWPAPQQPYFLERPIPMPQYPPIPKITCQHPEGE
jgi:hypothetical protein